MSKKYLLIGSLIATLTFTPLFAASPVPNFKVLIDQANKLTKLPKKITPSLMQVPTSRKAWFDSDCTSDFPSTELLECIGGNTNSKK